MLRRLFTIGFLCSVIGSADDGFSSIYVFGDGVSNTNNPPTSGGVADYHETRYCNGRVFVEVLADWQGVTFDTTKNTSDFGNDSSKLVIFANGFTDPGDAADSLFIIWSNNADFVDAIGADIDYPFTSTEPWEQLASVSISNHLTALQKLYDEGAREIVLPLAVDVMSVPFYADIDQGNRDFAKARISEYNADFKEAMLGFMLSKQGQLKIHLPDTFVFFEQVLADPGKYGLVNPMPLNVGGLDPPNPSINGNGSDYVFWDLFHPTAKFQMHLAAYIQQIVSPVKVNSVARSGSDVHLEVANIPLGRDGVILGSANLQPPWAQDAAIDEDVNTTQTFVFPANGPKRFYRVAFPVEWTWP